MATIYKCDKCNKIINDNKTHLDCLSYGTLMKYNTPSSFMLCEKCSMPFVKYLKKFLGIKKSKK